MKFLFYLIRFVRCVVSCTVRCDPGSHLREEWVRDRHVSGLKELGTGRRRSKTEKRSKRLGELFSYLSLSILLSFYLLHINK